MEKEKSNFPVGCFMPMNAIAVHPQGFPHFCLISKMSPESNLRALDDRAGEIHRQLLKGEWPDSCSHCRKNEAQHLPSRRERTWERKFARYGRSRAESFVSGQESSTLRHLEISFSNICNLNCSMCSSEYSTGWIKPEERAEAQGLEFRSGMKPFRHVRKLSDSFLEEILERSDELDLIIVKGGEPTYDPRCLAFLQKIARKRKENPPWVFIQSNGTRPVNEWLPSLEGLDLEIGISLDGWGPVYEWIRGTRFEPVLANFQELAKSDAVRELTLDFTLSLHNAFHLPAFLERITELREQVKKPFRCPSFQWARQAHATPLALAREDRLEIRDKARPWLENAGDFFQNGESLLEVLALPRASDESIRDSLRWLDYMTELRGFDLGADETLIRASLAKART